MKVSKINFNSNFNVGLFAFATDKFCLIGNEVSDKDVKEVESVLGVPVHQISIAGTSLIGVFLAGNSNKVLVPKIAFPYELEELSRLKIDYEVIDTKLTALGNNILCNDNGFIINPEFTAENFEKIKDSLGVEGFKGKIEGLHTVGSVAIANNKGCIMSKYAKEDEIEFAQETLGVKISQGTVNLGNTYLHSGVIANHTGLLVGSVSGGVEITDIDNALSGKNE